MDEWPTTLVVASIGGLGGIVLGLLSAMPSYQVDEQSAGSLQIPSHQVARFIWLRIMFFR